MKDYSEIKEQAMSFEGIADISINDDAELFELTREATSYILRHEWCKSIIEGWMGLYWEGVFAIFLFQIEPLHTGVDNYVWIVVGDIPPAYIDVESGRDPKEVLESYIFIMNEWANNIIEGQTVEESYPLEVPPTIEYATMLKKRLDILNSFREQEFD